MTLLRRPAAWPLVLSLAAHAALALWWWQQAPPAARISAAPAKPPMVWLRLASAPAAAPAATTRRTVAGAKAPAASKPRPKRTTPPSPVATTELQPPAEPAAPAAPVAGIAFGPPRIGLPFGAAARAAWTPHRAVASAVVVPPSAAGPPPQAHLPLSRQQSLDGVLQQVAEWSVPEHLTAARCRVWTKEGASGEDGAKCDPPSLAETLAQRLAALRGAWTAYRHLSPEAPASIEVAITDGRFALMAPTQAITGTSE